MAIARDKFWIFGVRAHQDDIWLGKGKEDRWYQRSRITPAEAALMLDCPNMLMINCDGEPVPFSTDAYGYMESFCRMDSVLWGVTGSAGFRVGNEEAFICELAQRYPNLKGAFMDDFFLKFHKLPNGMELAENLLKEIRSGLDKACRPMELWAVWYTREFDLAPPELLNYLDGLTLWTWHCEELPLLEERFEWICKNFPNHKKRLGIYMYDFPSGQPVPQELMELQCELGLKWMQEGKLDGLIFECNATMGVGLPSELWLREWVDKVKYTPVPD